MATTGPSPLLRSLSLHSKAQNESMQPTFLGPVTSSEGGSVCTVFLIYIKIKTTLWKATVCGAS